ncbi:DNA-directed RNA polymerase sigma-70 factor [Longimycelium tulufanense]|uniref:DNA-directed RNA polymerase sigma-70 factor n=1 Tax=Longimycelium tulufanense TaxID=907463 RepID=A0A8J3CI09_9PSEU|nr:sigma-70 family RNA polymerase sigma factor [Longimycelium tulufanense]GGM69751.1 DNA-directed RNA polymerase sigma-70 factor [Longimycelium tulufanense]
MTPSARQDTPRTPDLDRPVKPDPGRAGAAVPDQHVSPDVTHDVSTATPTGPEQDEAWELVRAAQRGDTYAFGRLYDRYVDVVFRYVFFRLGDRSLAEDVTSETFLRALRRITSISYQGRDVGAWFVTIARNLVLDHVKSSRYRLEVPTAELAEPRHPSTGPEQEVLDEATHAELLRCVGQLNKDQRECIVLRFMQGLSVAETARVMGRNEGAVKALQHRAVRRLAQLLPKELR